MSATANEMPAVRPFATASDRSAEMVAGALRQLRSWIEVRDYSGHEPYDILNSPFLSSSWLRKRLPSVAFVQISRRWGGTRLRSFLRVPPSKNPKALALILASYCDLIRTGEPCHGQAVYLKSELRRLRSPREETFCWGYDWDVCMLRNTSLPAFSPHAIATVFGGQGLLDFAQIADDAEAAEMASSAGRFVVSRLNRTVDTAEDLCLSYTPADRGRVYNSSALAAAFLARLGALCGFPEGYNLARRVMHYLVREQRKDGSWFYGAGRFQRWVDNFHTGYNLTALLEYQETTGDESFDGAIRKGYDYYQRRFFDFDGAPKYFHDRRYPVDIHSCAQAILTFCAFSNRDAGALERALDVASWTLRHMRGHDGAFYYQKHRLRLNRTPYMRWGQAWMFRALSRLHLSLRATHKSPVVKFTHVPRSAAV